MRRNYDALEEQYTEWLEKMCKCPNVDLGECECIEFEDWLDELDAARYADYDETDLEEMSG